MLVRYISSIVITLAMLSTISRATTTTLNVGTADNAANWNVTGAGAVDVPAMQRRADISVTSDAKDDGTFITGGSLAAFDGFWYADESFAVPADATNVAFTFSGLQGDDRVVMELNGTIVGDFFKQGDYSNPPATGSGLMSFPPGPPDAAYTFTGITSESITTGFNIGAVNDIRLIINNTNSGKLTAVTKTFQDDSDSTNAQFVGTVSYDEAPEPASAKMLYLVSMFCLMGFRFPRRAMQPS